MIPEWMDQQSRLLLLADPQLIRAKLDLIESTLGLKHLGWFEHKGTNQCKICDLIIICRKWEQLYDAKSPLDNMNVDKDYQYNSALDQEPLCPSE